MKPTSRPGRKAGQWPYGRREQRVGSRREGRFAPHWPALECRLSLAAIVTAVG